MQDTDLDSPNALSSIKTVLSKALPQLLARLPKLTKVGNVYSVMIEPTVGMVLKKLGNGDLHLHIDFLSLSVIEKLSFDMFSKVNNN